MFIDLHSVLMDSDRLFGTAAILAGGESRRFGSNKALALWRGKPLIEVITGQLKPLFADIVIITNSPEIYRDYPVRVTEDILKQKGPLGGIHAALKSSLSEYVFVTACDMPFVSAPLTGYMKSAAEKYLPSAVIACRGDFPEPFHGFYSRALIPLVEQAVCSGSGSVVSLLQNSGFFKIEYDTVRLYSPDGKVFVNFNRPEDVGKYIDSDHFPV